MTREELIEIMDNTWGEDEDCIDTLLEFLGGDAELVADVLKHDRSFNRYYCSYSWSDLAYEIIHDDAFDGDEYQESEDFIFLSENADNESVVEAFLIDKNWAIDKSTGIAIGFDDDVYVINHEVE